MGSGGGCGCGSGGVPGERPAKRPAVGSAIHGYHVDHRGRPVDDGRAPIGSRSRSSGASGPRATEAPGLAATQRFPAPRELPLGTRPSVAPPPVIRPPLVSPEIRDPLDRALDMAARRAGGMPFGGPRLPGAASPASYAMDPGLPVQPSQRGQYLPAPPAPQALCVVNGFDAGWGEPPERVWDLPLPFDQGLGAYRFDAEYSRARVDLDARRLAAQTFHELERRWEGGAMLQPWKRAGDDAWRYRWVPRVRNVVCDPMTVAGSAPPTG